MARITSINAPAMNVLRTAIDAALAKVAEEHGVTLQTGKGKYGDTFGSFELKIGLPDADGKVVTKEGEDFRYNASVFGFQPDDLFAEFTVRGEKYTITGMNARASKMPILAKRADGKGFKFSAPSVLRAMNRDVPAWLASMER